MSLQNLRQGRFSYVSGGLPSIERPELSKRQRIHFPIWPQQISTSRPEVVASVENGTVHTIEGNSGDACRERSYSVGYYEILGYGVLQVGDETDNSNNETPTQ